MPITDPISSPPINSDKHHYATFWDRYAAMLIDSVILFPIILGLLGVIGLRIYSQVKGLNWGLFLNNPELFERHYGAMLEKSSNSVGAFAQIPTWLYFVYFTYKNKATPGKKLLKLEVADKNNQPLKLLPVILRETLGKALSSFVFSLGYAWMLWDKNKQTWHDKIANSYVYRTGENKKIKLAVIGAQIILMVLFAAGGVWAIVKLSQFLPNEPRSPEFSHKPEQNQIWPEKSGFDVEKLFEQLFPELPPSDITGKIT